MPASRASNRSAAVKTRRGLDASPSLRTRSQTHRDRLCALLLKLDPAAITRAVKLLEAYGDERRSSQRLAEWDRLVVKQLGGRRSAQVKTEAPKPVASRSSRAGRSSTAPAVLNTPGPLGPSPTTSAPSTTLNPATRFESIVNSSPPSAARPPFFHAIIMAKEINHFRDNVLIVKGDIGSITHIGNHRIAGIAFPTASNLLNSGTGAADAVFRRAGDELSAYIRKVYIYGSRPGTARVTPGFGAGVDKLILAVGPKASASSCHNILENAYDRVMEIAQTEKLQCLALSPISTGAHGIPCGYSAQLGLRAIRSFQARNNWTGVVGIVCNDQEVFDESMGEKQDIIEADNARLLRLEALGQ